MCGLPDLAGDFRVGPFPFETGKLTPRFNTLGGLRIPFWNVVLSDGPMILNTLLAWKFIYSCYFLSTRVSRVNSSIILKCVFNVRDFYCPFAE